MLRGPARHNDAATCSLTRGIESLALYAPGAVQNQADRGVFTRHYLERSGGEVLASEGVDVDLNEASRNAVEREGSRLIGGAGYRPSAHTAGVERHADHPGRGNATGLEHATREAARASEGHVKG